MANRTRPNRQLVLSLVLMGALAACGGGGTATIGGAVNGLRDGSSVTLQDNNADNLTISSNQGFIFPTSLGSGATYNVTVLSEPVGQSCVVTGGTGIVDSGADDITNVAVACSLSSSIGGTVAGLALGNSVWLANGSQLLPIAANGSFAFPGVLPAGTSYNVVVSAQPAQQTCVVANGSGTVAAGVMAAVSVTCT